MVLLVTRSRNMEKKLFEIVLLSLVRSVAATKLTTMARFTD